MRCRGDAVLAPRLAWGLWRVFQGLSRAGRGHIVDSRESLYVRRHISRRPIDDAFIDRVVDRLT